MQTDTDINALNMKDSIETIFFLAQMVQWQKNFDGVNLRGKEKKHPLSSMAVSLKQLDFQFHNLEKLAIISGKRVYAKTMQNKSIAYSFAFPHEAIIKFK